MDSQLADIIDRCLSISPSRRFPNAQAVLDRLTERERQRSRRPLLLLGFVLPLLLSLSVVPLTLNAIYDALSTARGNLAQRALESDVLTANLLANSLERDLVDRREELLGIAQGQEFRSMVEEYASLPLDQRQDLMDMLDEKFATMLSKRRELNRRVDSSWFLNDAEGYQRWHRESDGFHGPETPLRATLDRKFSYRSYFHGLDENFTAETAPADLRPLRSPRISRPYLSTNSRSGQYRVALSVPIWDSTHENVIGVLGRSLELGDLFQDYERAVTSPGEESVDRVLALIDSRKWKLIAHTDWQLGEYERLAVSPETQEQLTQLLATPAAQVAATELDRTDEYFDPMGEIQPEKYGGRWLAAFCRVGDAGWADTGWIAVVQERRSAAFRAMDDLRKRIWMFGLTAVAIVIALVAGCWWIIVRLVNERPLHWWPSNPGGGNWPAAGTLNGTARGGDRV